MVQPLTLKWQGTGLGGAATDMEVAGEGLGGAVTDLEVAGNRVGGCSH